jgi:phosphinothricin acetyltransferase
VTELAMRHGRPSDLDAITRIYAHYVATTHVTFDLEPPEAKRQRAWLGQFSDTGSHQLFVADAGEGAIGFACSTPFKSRAAYAVSVETTVYLDPEKVGGGLGGQLMRCLLNALTHVGVHRAYAGIALPNETSEALHDKLGYRRIGVLTEVGKKFDRYWDVAWYEKCLGED